MLDNLNKFEEKGYAFMLKTCETTYFDKPETCYLMIILPRELLKPNYGISTAIEDNKNKNKLKVFQDKRLEVVVDRAWGYISSNPLKSNMPRA